MLRHPRALPAAGTKSVFEVESKPVPISKTQEIGATCRYRRIEIYNPTEGVLTVTLEDGKGNPIDSAPLGKGGSLVLTCDAPGRLCRDGITWQADGDGLQGYILAEPHIEA